MAATKPINKSVRISEQVYEIVNSYPGEGFNNKYESLVIEAFVTENERRQTLAELNKQIAKAEKELRDIHNKIKTGLGIVDRLSVIRQQADFLDKNLHEFVSQK